MESIIHDFAVLVGVFVVGVVLILIGIRFYFAEKRANLLKLINDDSRDK